MRRPNVLLLVLAVIPLLAGFGYAPRTGSPPSWLAEALAAVSGTAARLQEPVVVAQADPEEPASTGTAEATAEEATLGLEDIVSRLQSFYDDIDSYHADFEQRYTNLALGETIVSSGHVFFKKPGMMRWDYQTPEEKYLISDGETLWIYEPEFNQVARGNLANNDLPTAIRFLMGEGNLAEDFEISREDCDENDAYCLHLVPRVSQGQYRSLEFIVNTEDFSVRETTIVDPVGNTNHFSFSNAVTNDALPDAGFHFNPTPDMRIITP